METIEIKGLDEKVYFDKCENGLEIYVWQNPRVNSFKGSICFKAGSEQVSFKMDKVKYELPFGVAHYLEHIMCKNADGTPLLGSFNQLGCYSNAATYSDKTVYEFMGSNNLKEALDLLLDSVQNKEFQEDYFEMERGAILEEARMRLDDVARLSLYGINQCLFSKYPNRVIGLGTLEDIKNMTLDDLKTFYQAFYHPSNSVVVVCGNVDALSVIQWIKENQKKKEFSKKPKVTLTKYREPEKVICSYQEIEANVEIPKVFINVKIPRKKWKEYDSLLLLSMLNVTAASNFGITSLFRERLFEKKLAVTLGALFYLERDYIVFQVTAKTKYPEECIKALEEKMNSLDIDAQDINRKRKSEIANLVLGYEDPDYVNNMLNYYLVKYGKVITNEKEILESIDIEAIKELFADFKIENCNVFVMKPKEQ